MLSAPQYLTYFKGSNFKGSPNTAINSTLCKVSQVADELPSGRMKKRAAPASPPLILVPQRYINMLLIYLQ